MPKNPPDLPRPPASANPVDWVQVQQANFSYDVLGRYVCNDWGETAASLTDAGFPFDAVVIGRACYGSAQVSTTTMAGPPPAVRAG